MAKKTLTYVDSNVLIYAVNQRSLSLRLRALKVLGDKQRTFLASQFQWLETMPYAVNAQRRKEVAFLKAYFDRHVDYWVKDERDLFEPASRLIEQYNMQLMDALHLAAAMENDADFVTGERPTKPFHQAYKRVLWIADV